jgi:hypothetical protein
VNRDRFSGRSKAGNIPSRDLLLNVDSPQRHSRKVAKEAPLFG